MKSDEAAAACVAAGAVPALVAALTTHAGEAGVCRAACGALCNIVKSDEAAAACVAAGAVPAIVAALEAHAGEAGVCEVACNALGRITWSDEGRAACLASGAVPAIVAALGTHAGEAGLCREACGALHAISWIGSDEGGAACLAAGAVPAIVVALGTHVGNADTCEGACKALGSIARTAEGRAACVAAGALSALLATIAAEDPAADAARAALQNIQPPVPSTLALLALPPLQLEARLASCLECWASTPRAPCPHRPPPECAICYDNVCEMPWLALPCGHLVHAGCMMEWAAAETRGARAAAALPTHTAAHCPLDRSVVTRLVPLGEALPEGAVAVAAGAPVPAPP
jgi:hypothetical protein